MFTGISTKWCLAILFTNTNDPVIVICAKAKFMYAVQNSICPFINRY